MSEPVSGEKPFAGLRACFFMRTREPEVLSRNEFYRVDLQILEDLGFETIVCTDPLRVPSADVYFVWWWTYAFFPLLRAKLARRPVVVVGTFDHVLPDGRFEYYPNRPRAHRALIRWTLRNADANVVCADDQKEAIERSFPVRNLSVSPHVVDTERYHPSQAPKKPLFVTMCWMHNDNAVRKCVATSIRAMALARERLPNHRLLVAGDKGDGYPTLQTLADELGVADRVEFPGKVTPEEKIDLFQSCTAYLQPTLAEGFGVAILEAMSCGAPIVVSPVGGVPSVVGDVGLRVDGLDAAGLADAMVRFTTEPALAAAQGAAARRRAVAEFSYARRLGDLRGVLQRTIRGRD